MIFYYDTKRNTLYSGDMQPGDRKATDEEIAMYQADAWNYYTHENGVHAPDESRRAELLAMRKNQIDAETDAVILTGFEYAGNKFKLSLENQINYKAECELRETLTYPHRVKTLDGYYDFQNAADYYAFYLAGIQFIRQTIEQGWTQKDALDLLSTEELIKSLKLKVES